MLTNGLLYSDMLREPGSRSGTYCVQARLVAGEGEGEAQRQTSTFHPHVVQEVGDAVNDVVEELQRDVSLVVCVL